MVSQEPGQRPLVLRRRTRISSWSPTPRRAYVSTNLMRVSVKATPLPPAAEYGFQSGGERAGAERFGEKIIRAKLKHAHFVVLVAFGGQDDDRNVGGRGPRAQMGQYAVAVEPRKVQIEHDDVGPDAIDLIERLHAVARLGHRIAFALQQVAHDAA